MQTADKSLCIDEAELDDRRKPMLKKPFTLSLVFLLLIPGLHPAYSFGGDLYRWVDEEGTVHVTDTVSQVPSQYRNQVDRKNLQTTTQPELKPEFQSKAAGARSERAMVNLKHFEIPYQAFEGTSRRIIIPVTFNGGVSAHLLLDTGSPGLMISPKLAGRLGLLDEKTGGLLVMASGIGGSVPAILAVVDTVSVGDAITEFLPATIAQIPSIEFEGLVGMDFMANYSISIDTANSIVAFHELPPQLDRPGGHDEAWWRSNFQRFAKLKAQWSNFLDDLEKGKVTSSEWEKRIAIAKNQHEEADKLCRKLERYARDNAVPIEWRR
jgi:hypothetical protein